jgi:hypothetical protein
VSFVGEVWSPSFIWTDDEGGVGVSALARLLPRAKAVAVLEVRNCLRFIAIASLSPGEMV